MIYINVVFSLILLVLFSILVYKIEKKIKHLNNDNNSNDLIIFDDNEFKISKKIVLQEGYRLFLDKESKRLFVYRPLCFNEEHVKKLIEAKDIVSVDIMYGNNVISSINRYDKTSEINKDKLNKDSLKNKLCAMINEKEVINDITFNIKLDVNEKVLKNNKDEKEIKNNEIVSLPFSNRYSVKKKKLGFKKMIEEIQCWENIFKKLVDGS